MIKKILEFCRQSFSHPTFQTAATPLLYMYQPLRLDNKMIQSFIFYLKCSKCAGLKLASFSSSTKAIEEVFKMFQPTTDTSLWEGRVSGNRVLKSSSIDVHMHSLTRSRKGWINQNNAVVSLVWQTKHLKIFLQHLTSFHLWFVHKYF